MYRKHLCLLYIFQQISESQTTEVTNNWARNVKRDFQNERLFFHNLLLSGAAIWAKSGLNRGNGLHMPCNYFDLVTFVGCSSPQITSVSLSKIKTLRLYDVTEVVDLSSKKKHFSASTTRRHLTIIQGLNGDGKGDWKQL